MGKKIVKSYFRPPEKEDEIVAIVDKNMGNGILNVKLPNLHILYNYQVISLPNKESMQT